MENPLAKTDATRGKRCVAEPIVGSAFVRVHQDVIRFAQFFEFFLSVRVVRILIWMKLHREFAIGAFHLLFGGASFNAKHLVVIAFFGGRHMATSLCD